MALNTDSLYRPLRTVRQDLLKVIDELDALNSAAVGFGGVIGSKLPVNVNSLLEKVEGLVSGQGTDSVDSIIEFLDSVPMGDIREKSAEERAAAQQPLSRTGAPAGQPAAPIDMTAHTENGPQTAVKESMSLEDFYKDEFKGKKTKIHEATDFSWDAILDNPNLEPMDLGDGVPTVDGVYTDEGQIPGDEFLSQFAVPESEAVDDPAMEEGAPVNDYSDFVGADAQGQVLDESISQRGWKNALHAANPIDFGLDMNTNISSGLSIIQ